MAALEDSDRDPIQPQYLMRVVDRFAADDAILCSDSGTIATWAARHFDIRGDRQFYLSGNLASMAPGLPYTIAAQWAHPNRQCIAFVGDGGFAMLMAEFDTACRYGLPIKVVINNNSSLGQILWEQMVLGYPEYGVRFQQSMNFAPFAESCGGLGVHVDKAGDVERAVRSALDQPGPALVDVMVNPDEPPMPGRSPTTRPRGSPRRGCGASPTRRRWPPPCSATSSTSCGADPDDPWRSLAAGKELRQWDAGRGATAVTSGRLPKEWTGWCGTSSTAGSSGPSPA
jgi:thiamine pyrophosphate-dependent acetolactate synthase large subunit-like protein